jgi:hypothetical protein
MSKIIEFPADGSIIPFDHPVEQYASTVILLSLGYLGAMAQLIVVVANFRQGIYSRIINTPVFINLNLDRLGINNINVGTIFLLSLCIADLLFTVTSSTFAATTLYQSGWYVV